MSDIDEKLIEFKINALICIQTQIKKHGLFKDTVFYNVFKDYDRKIEKIYQRLVQK